MSHFFHALAGSIVARLIVGLARVVTGVRADWRGCEPVARQRIYIANHTSHGDFVLIWTVLPPALRSRTRPVAARDYWGGEGLAGFIGQAVFRAALVDRAAGREGGDPLQTLKAVLATGESLIFFPEGTRNTSDEILLPLKSGIFHLAEAFPEVEIVPVWIDNVSRVMPKGEFLPVPLLCKVSFGVPVNRPASHDKATFLEAVRAGLLALAPPENAR